MFNEYGFEPGEIVEVEIPKGSDQWHFATLLEVGGGLVTFALEIPLQDGGYGMLGLSSLRKPSPEKLPEHFPSPYPWEEELKIKKEEEKKREEELERQRLEEWERAKPEREAMINEILNRRWWHCLRFWKRK